jgi:hypothetical protein
MSVASDLVASISVHLSVALGSNAVGYQTASAKYRCNEPEFISGVSASALTVNADSRLTCPDPLPWTSASWTRTCINGAALTRAFHTKPAAGGTTMCSASKDIQRSLATSVRNVPVCLMRTSWMWVVVEPNAGNARPVPEDRQAVGSQIVPLLAL